MYLFMLTTADFAYQQIKCGNQTNFMQHNSLQHIPFVLCLHPKPTFFILHDFLVVK